MNYTTGTMRVPPGDDDCLLAFFAGFGIWDRARVGLGGFMGVFEYFGRFSRDVVALLNWSTQRTGYEATYLIRGGPIGQSVWTLTGTIARFATHAYKGVGPALTARNYWRESQDVGRTVAYTGVVAGVPAVGGWIVVKCVAGGVATLAFWPAVAIGGGVAAGGVVLNAMYQNNALRTQDFVHWAGDRLNEIDPNSRDILGPYADARMP